MEEPKVVNITRYMPVEEETAGGIPILNKTGLKIAPPPSPRAPETQPPTNATETKLFTTLGENLRSLLLIPFPYLIL